MKREDIIEGMARAAVDKFRIVKWDDLQGEARRFELREAEAALTWLESHGLVQKGEG